MIINIKNLLRPEAFDHPVKKIELIETHISWVILTGDFAYKIKKPVNFGFLDFSTLEKRKQFCELELKLNSRLAAAIYLGLVSIVGTEHRPKISGKKISNTGQVIEYAVKMVQFPQSAQLDNMLTAGRLKLDHMDAFARMIADFHQTAETADNTMDYGNSDIVCQPVEENFLQIKQHLDTKSYEGKLDTLSRCSKTEAIRLEAIFKQRKCDGFIRHCHGDMHLRNMVWLNEQPMAFDCIEFNAKFSWIDVISEIAFLVMDCHHRQQRQLANRFLNSYLEVTGDYNGITVLPYYLGYRAMVRAKVSVLRLDQTDISAAEKQQMLFEFESYLDLASSYSRSPVAKLIIMSGMSASGKSTVSQQLVDKLGVIRIRSDIERKRLFAINTSHKTAISNDTDSNTNNAVDSGIYSKQASQQTYAKLASLASAVISAGYSVIIDAAFLKQEQRQHFQKLAEHLKVSFVIVEVSAAADILRQRIVQRKNDISDADLAVLEHQLNSYQALHPDEASRMIPVNTEKTVDIDRLIDNINNIE